MISGAMVLLAAAAWALPPVEEELSEGKVDWTRLQLIATADGVPPGGSVNTMEGMEGAARSQLGPRMLKLSREVRITSELTAGDLLGNADAVADRLDANLSIWEVQEARYYTSGKVELEGALPLQRWLRPALVSMADGKERESPPESPFTGLVLDARGLVVTPAVAPRILGPDGVVLYSIRSLTEDAAATTGPAVWVRDPADSTAVTRAGEVPLLLAATAVSGGCDLVLSAEDAATLVDTARGSPLLLHGRVVVVVSQ